MNEVQITQWLGVLSALVDVGAAIGGKFVALWHLFGSGDHGLTDGQVNALEQAAIDGDDARAAARRIMALAG